MAWIVELLAVLLASVLIAILYCKRIYTHWEKKNIPGPKPVFLLGTSQNPVTRKEPIFHHLKKIYDTFRAKGAKHCGIFSFTSPAYMPLDPDRIKNILTRDFQHFASRGMYYNEKVDPMSAHLVSLDGQRWKTLRGKLTSTFTSGKMKMMFPILLECGDQMLRAMEKLRGEPIDVKEVLGCFTTDVIGSCAFGLECNSFVDGDSEFRSHGRKAFAPSITGVMRVLFCVNFPNIAGLLRMRINNPEVSDFYMDVVKKTVDYREKNNVLRNDFMQILIELKNVDGDEGLTIEEIAAQAFIFFLAGFETSSTTMTFCLYELAQNQDVQEKIRVEIERVLGDHGGKITYEAVVDLKYMEQAIDETLRKYPAAPILNRKCTKRYPIPECDSVLEEGTRVVIPTYALHHDAQHYPNPDVFDPDRFDEEHKAKRHPFAYLPFGEGPRVCIGMRFGLMQTKVGLLLLLKNYRFSLNERTSVPVKFDPNAFLLGLKEKIWLDVKPVS